MDIDQLPFSPELIEEKYRSILFGGNHHLVTELKELSGVLPSPELLQKVFDTNATKGDVNRIKRIAKVTSVDPQISTEAIQQGYMSLANREGWQPINSQEEIIDYFYHELQVPPSQETLDVLYTELIGKKADYCAYEQKYGGKTPLWWDVLKDTFGVLPSREAVQALYRAELSSP